MTVDQPFLHDLTVALRAPVQVWSNRSGTIEDEGVQGVYIGDRRVLRSAHLHLETALGPVPLVHGATTTADDGEVTFHWLARLYDATADPVASLTRTRTARIDGVDECVRVAGSLPEPTNLVLTLRIRPDAEPLDRIKAGRPDRTAVPPTQGGWRSGTVSVRPSAPGAEIVADADDLVLRWTFTLPANGAVDVTWHLDADDARMPFAGVADAGVRAPALRAASPSLQRLVRQSVADLNALRLAEATDGGAHRFYAAGAPWFLTLFGRDSLIAARLALPIDASMALSTLRTLAARQGVRHDVERAEEPGKILHEVRAAPLELSDGTTLPPEYYGTIDATPLWILLLGDLVQGGADPNREGLYEPLLAALAWMRDSSDPDRDGFAEYFDHSGHGLTNQGWKDSGDSVRFADGTLAEGPIALAEVQGYLYAAALAGAAMIERFGDDAGTALEWREWAARLRTAFRDRFWLRDARGRYPAMALDRHKTPVSGVSSNIGHLLGTGLLDPAEEAVVVERLMSPDMFSGYGIRTASTDNLAYWPTRYHVGSVWSHDTAMIIDGMLRSGWDVPARRLAEGLLLAAEGFQFRLPELFAGYPADVAFPPVPYPAACRPQAWAAASGVTVARALGAL